MNRLLIASAALMLAVSPALAAEDPQYEIILKDYKFTPAELTIPADTKVKVTVKNEGNATAEFESHDLRREKLIAPGGKVIVSIGPLKPGKYEYFDEFHEDKSRGFIIVK